MGNTILHSTNYFRYFSVNYCFYEAVLAYSTASFLLVKINFQENCELQFNIKFIVKDNAFQEVFYKK